jgi:REP element-mobilizing transposase RayT
MPYARRVSHVTEKGYRLSLISADIQQVIYTAIIAKCQKLGCTVITVGGRKHHIHLLTGFLTALGVADMMKQIKGSSFHLDTHQIKPGKFFKWQGS